MAKINNPYADNNDRIQHNLAPTCRRTA